uniref:Uncharacterized protein n=1 Tax=Arundo donax TaxID=35708 RepID=A0A0A9G6W7_ARUDO
MTGYQNNFHQVVLSITSLAKKKIKIKIHSLSPTTLSLSAHLSGHKNKIHSLSPATLSLSLLYLLHADRAMSCGGGRGQNRPGTWGRGSRRTGHRRAQGQDTGAGRGRGRLSHGWELDSPSLLCRFSLSLSLRGGDPSWAAAAGRRGRARWARSGPARGRAKWGGGRCYVPGNGGPCAVAEIGPARGRRRRGKRTCRNESSARTREQRPLLRSTSSGLPSASPDVGKERGRTGTPEAAGVVWGFGWSCFFPFCPLLLG